MTVKMVFDGDSTKLRAEYAKVLQSEKALVAQTQALTKESEKAQQAAQKEIELRRKAVQVSREATEEARKLRVENAKQASEIERIAQQTAKQKAAQSGMLSTGLAAAQGMIASYVSLNTAIQVVTAAMERQRQVSEKSLTETERVARAQSQVVFNMPGASREQVSNTDSRIRAAAASAGVSLPAFYETVAQTSAATGGDIEAAIRGASAAAPLSRLDPSAMPVVSSAAAEIARATGLGEEQSLGLMMQYGGVARQTNTQQIAQSLPEAIAAGAGASSDRAVGAEWAMERMAALSVETGDREGRRSATAVANLAVKMERFFGERESLGVEANPYAREEYLRQNPELAHEFMAGLSGEITSYIPIREMFREGSGMHARVQGTQAAIDAAGAQGMYERTVEAATSGTPELEAANRAAASQARTDAMMLTPGKSTRAQVNDEVRRALEASGDGSSMGGWGAFAAQMEYDWASSLGDPLTAGEATVGRRNGGVLQSRERSSAAADPAALKVLEEIRDQLKRQNEEPSHAVDTGVRQ